MEVGAKTHLKRMGLVLVAILALVVIGRIVFTPGGFGRYGHYRAGAIEDEVARPLVHKTNATPRVSTRWCPANSVMARQPVMSLKMAK